MAIAWIAGWAVLILLVGLVLLCGGRGIRSRRGLGPGQTLALGDKALYSPHYGLAGRSERLIRDSDDVSWRSGREPPNSVPGAVPRWWSSSF